MRPVGHPAWQVKDDLGISRADHRHQVHLAPDLRRLRPEVQPINRERLVDAINGRPQDGQLLRAVAIPISGVLILGVRQVRSQNHEQKSRQQCSTGKTHKASRQDGQKSKGEATPAISINLFNYNDLSEMFQT
jgi:hypothetical protein